MAPYRPLSDALYPLSLKLSGRLVAIIGAGKVAARKVETLLRHGAHIRLIAPEAVFELRHLASEGTLDWLPRRFEPRDLDDCSLVFAATQDQAVNRQVFDEAHRRGLFVNVVDVPHLCDFYVPSVIRRGPMTVAISSGGCSPAFSRNFSRQLAKQISPSLGDYLELLAAARAEVRCRIPNDEKRRMKLNSALVECGADRLVEVGDLEGARGVLWRLIDSEAGND